MALIAVSLVCSPAFALDPMGPPAGEILKGEYKGGIEFCISSQDLETTPGTYTQHADGVLEASGKASLETIENFQTYRAYATVAYSPIHSWEAFLRLGATSATLGDEFWSEGEEFDSRTEFAIGGGLRATFFEEIALKIGGLIQANWSNFDGKVDASHWAAPHLLEIDLFEVQAALGATYMFSDRLSIYGGPFAHVIYGDLDYEYSEENVGDLITWRFNWDIEDDINYGGYFGARIALKRDCSFNIEYQQTSDASAIAASLLWRL
ncbi:MAG TPA: hypothetical protein VJ733_11955 [Candidatus Binatia bacterium]|nr:hypothetical protein [Candidatus Binatia bacterium]